MKVYLTEEKFLDINVTNWNIAEKDKELNLLQKYITEYMLVLAELPVYFPSKSEFRLINVLENEYVFDRALTMFCNKFNLRCE